MIKFLSTVKNSRVWQENAARALCNLLRTFSSFTLQTQTQQCIRDAETVHMGYLTLKGKIITY